jgi:hypothetical protein
MKSGEECSNRIFILVVLYEVGCGVFESNFILVVLYEVGCVVFESDFYISRVV